MHTKNQSIAVFDSGIGGISVLKELVRLMPNERYLYYGDNANAPYGNRSTQAVRDLTLQAAQKLMDRDIKALVVACNTATAAAIDLLRKTYPDTVIVGIEPAVKLAADRYGGTIGIMATEVTLRETKLAQLVQRFAGTQMLPIHAPGLVALIEAGASDDRLLDYLAPILTPYVGRLEAVVLGCTHYPFARHIISALLPDTQLLDGGEGTARQTQRLLAQAGLLSDGPGEIIIESSSPDPAVLRRAQALLR